MRRILRLSDRLPEGKKPGGDVGRSRFEENHQTACRVYPPRWDKLATELLFRG